jgi:hypothetical protein
MTVNHALMQFVPERRRSTVGTARALAVLAFTVLTMGALLPGDVARAQTYASRADQTPPPLYPYVPQNPPRRVDRRSYAPYAGEVAWRGYRVVHRPAHRRVKIVREPPVVIVSKRYVDDPPRVVKRYRFADDQKTREPARHIARKDDSAAAALAKTPDKVPEKLAGQLNGKQGESDSRVIQADAEVTILGPDRMSIQLYRKGDGHKANARAP